VDCSAGSNSGNGVNAALTAHVRACSAAGNGAAGIAAGRGALVAECAAIGNGGAGVFASNGLCRIEGNHLVLNGSGFYVTGSGNIVARNTVSDPEGGVGLLPGSGPGGVYLADPPSARLTIPGLGSVLHKQASAVEPEVIQDGGQLAPWANIVVR
jgi:parallel beta-helix repeat protein